MTFLLILFSFLVGFEVLEQVETAVFLKYFEHLICALLPIKFPLVEILFASNWRAYVNRLFVSLVEEIHTGALIDLLILKLLDCIQPSRS